MKWDEKEEDNGVEITKQSGSGVFHSDFFRKTSYFTNIFLSENVLLMWWNVVTEFMTQGEGKTFIICKHILIYFKSAHGDEDCCNEGH